MEPSAPNPIIPFIERDGRLMATSGDTDLANNHPAGRGTVADNEGVGGPFRYRLYEVLPDEGARERPLLRIDGETLATPFAVPDSGVPERLLALVLRDIRNLPAPQYEIWHRDYAAVPNPIHLADRWGNASELLDCLRRALPDMPPPEVTFDKVSSKPEDRFGCNHMHVDSFPGMRVDSAGCRRAVDRYFFNLDERRRYVLVAPLSVRALVALVPPEEQPVYVFTNLYRSLLAAASFDIPLLKLPTPPRDRRRGLVFGLRLRTTHMFHGEYGPRGDFLAIVNGLPRVGPLAEEAR